MSPKPLNAEEIADTLKVARSNVSTSLKELQNWGIVKLVHVLGDKRDHFESPKDVWAMFKLVLNERKRREIDPTIALLEACMAEAASDKEGDPYTDERLRELHQFFRTTSAFYEQMGRLPSPVLVKMMNAGDKLLKTL